MMGLIGLSLMWVGVIFLIMAVIGAASLKLAMVAQRRMGLYSETGTALFIGLYFSLLAGAGGILWWFA